MIFLPLLEGCDALSHQCRALFLQHPGRPCDATEIAQATLAIAEHDGPVYMRLLRGQVPVTLDPASHRFELGKARLLADGSDVAIISTGLMTARALQARGALQENGINAAVLHVSTIKPFDVETISALLRRIPRVVTAENHMITGGLGSAVADLAVDAGLNIKLRRIGIPDCFCESGTLPYLAKRYRMDSESIAEAVQDVLALR